jgi:hypothetical protein
MKIQEILSVYVISHEKEELFGKQYSFSNERGDYLEILVFDKTTVRFIDDNFPFPRRAFCTDIPYRSIDDFESDLKRMRIEIPTRKTAK